VKFRLLLTLLLALVMVNAAAGSAAASDGRVYRHRLIERINHVRAEHGLAPLRNSLGLHRAAQRHSADMVDRDYFAHTSPSGSTLYLRIERSGIRSYGQWWAGETLAWGTGSYGSVRATVRMWLHSPEHRAILLSSRYRLIGIGRATGRFLGYGDAVVWTADFGHR
jgi:uncharacterized protein YkwD